jgi:hypothetical protein
VTEKTIAVDPGALPNRPTEEDWYQVALYALQESGWNLSPNLTGVSVPAFGCQIDPEIEQLTMHFTDTYFDRVIPGIKFASVIIDRPSETASVSISYQLLRWRYSPIKTSDIQVGFYEALQIADALGGQDFRQSTNDRCEIHSFLSEYEWRIGHFETDGRSGWPDLRISVDARSGKARRLPD